MASQSNTSSLDMTLWLWPTGLYPRRIAYYLKAKNLPKSTLKDLKIIPVTLNKQAGALEALPGYEPRSAGTSLPCLRINDNTFIYQSSSILTYFEKLYGPSLSGSNAIHRAHVNDIVQHINESAIWTGVYIRHTTEMSLMWSGMTKDQQSPEAGADALKQWKSCMEKLENWVRKDVVDKRAKSIAGGDEATLADFTLMAIREYVFEMYGWDTFEGCEVLEEWHQRATSSEWFVSREELERFEVDGLDRLFKQ